MVIVLCHTNTTKKMTTMRQTLLAFLWGVYCCLMMTSGKLGLLVIVVTTLEKRKEMEERENKREVRGACDRNKCPPLLMVLNSFLSHFKYNKTPMKFNSSHMTFDKKKKFTKNFKWALNEINQEHPLELQFLPNCNNINKIQTLQKISYTTLVNNKPSAKQLNL